LKFPSDYLENIRKYPHLIGHLVGKTKLTEIHSDWIKYIWDSEHVPDLNGEFKNHRSLMGHRGSYKTTAITEIGCIWWLLFHPNDRIAIIRKPYTEAAKTLWTIKKYMQTEAIRALFYKTHGIFPDFAVKKENKLSFVFKKIITKEGNIDCYSIDGNYTGNHYDKILCDDIIILRDRISRAERENTKEGCRELITNIIDPNKQCMFVGTPWHEHDAWEILPPAIKFSADKTGILSAAELEEKKSRTTSVLFSINYKLEYTKDEGAIFQNPFYDHWDWKATDTIAHLDAKFKGNHTAALTFYSTRTIDGRPQMTGWIFHENVKEKTNWIVDQCKRMRSKKLYIENNPDKGYTGDVLKSAGLNVNEYAECANKHVKIVTFLKDLWKDVVWDNNVDPEYMNQILDYKEGEEPDDAPDSAASIIRAAQNKPINTLLALSKM
jgi:hypothetical protein